MTQLLQNAIDALTVGVEDYSADDPRRTLSAVRNFYAGTLLLAKEVLSRVVPKADPDEILGAKYKPVPDGKGGVIHVQDGHATIDFSTIGKRFKDFGVKADPKRLEQLNKIRNDIEHRYTTQTESNIREAIATAFPLVSEFFLEIDESPVEHLGANWQIMLETTQLYEAELQRCQATLAEVKWLSDTITSKNLSCQSCGSALIQQEDPSETDQNAIVLICKACGEDQDTAKVVEKALNDVHDVDAYIRAKEGQYEGPLFSCPECDLETFVDFEDKCGACGYEPDGDTECARCGNEIELDIRLNDGGSLCGYCAHMSEKIMRE